MATFWERASNSVDHIFFFVNFGYLLFKVDSGSDCFSSWSLPCLCILYTNIKTATILGEHLYLIDLRIFCVQNYRASGGNKRKINWKMS